jgi:hypothetical protein
MNDKCKERKVNVHWDGPIQISWQQEKIDLSPFNDPAYVIYMICGTNSLYGSNAPLYIGKTQKNTVMNRIGQHKINWINDEPNDAYVYAAAIHEFDDWKDLPNYFQRMEDEELISTIEMLLINAHQPAYNNNFKNQLSENCQNIRIFNTGRPAALYPEVSGFRYFGSWQAVVTRDDVESLDGQ